MPLPTGWPRRDWRAESCGTGSCGGPGFGIAMPRAGPLLWHPDQMATYKQSEKLRNVLYDIRGPLLEHAMTMEAQGHRILKLNIGNPAPFGFEAPDAILVDMIRNLPKAQGYSDS